MQPSHLKPDQPLSYCPRTFRNQYPRSWIGVPSPQILQPPPVLAGEMRTFRYDGDASTPQPCSLTSPCMYPDTPTAPRTLPTPPHADSFATFPYINSELPLGGNELPLAHLMAGWMVPHAKLWN